VSDEIEIRSVQVGRPSILGVTAGGGDVLSAIVKAPVTAATLSLSTINLDGDDQADRTVHGGPDKAVYVYSADHLDGWSTELGRPIGPGWFGENLTVAGVAESDVRIGDRWRWGEALVEICQPRWPCFKLTMHARVRDIGHRMKATGRTGWYLRVIEPGVVPTSGTVGVVSRHPAGVTVADAHAAQADRHREDPALIDRVAAVPELSEEWRGPLP
jgi:MOSC domain-containing protein YiiM